MEKNILDVVESINNDLLYNDFISDEFFESTFDDSYKYPLALKSTGVIYIIEFLGYIIYCNVEECREWDDNIGEYEDLEQYLRKQIKNVIKNYKELFKIWNKVLK